MTIETNNRQEAITDKILKKAEISRITLQLKKNLLRAGVKAQGNSPAKDDHARRKRSSSTTKEDNSSPLKRQSVHPPSSPIYDSTIIQPPKTPPLKAAKLPTPLLSTPKSHTAREFKTPNTKKMPSRLANGDVDEGADLLMFLATSPSPATHKERDYKMPLTPKHVSNHLTVPSGTPPASNAHNIRMNTPGRLHPKTPNFSMSDYVNFFTPSPRYSKPPDTGYLGGRTLNFDKGKD